MPRHAPQRFVQMRMGVDQTGQGNGALAIFYGVAVLRGYLVRDLCDAATVDQHVHWVSPHQAQGLQKQTVGHVRLLWVK